MARSSLLLDAIDLLLADDWPADELRCMDHRLRVVRLLQRVVDGNVAEAEMLARELSYADLLRDTRGNRASA